MRRFFYKLALLACFLLIILGLLELGFRCKPNVFKDKFDGLDSKKETVEVLCLGHSHTLNGINPDLMSGVAYNMGFGYQNVYYDEYLLTHFIDNMPSLKYVILSASCFHLFDPLPDLEFLRGENLFNAVKYHLYCNLKTFKNDTISMFNPKFNLEILNNPPKSYIVLTKYYLSLFNSKYTKYGPFFRNGYAPNNNVCSEEYLDSDGSRIASIHFPKTDVSFDKPYNYSIYENIARICKQHGIKLVVVLYPTWHTYRENASNNQYEVTSFLFEKLEDEYDNCIFLDYSSDSDFSVEDFSDSNHLNSHGAEKMTEKLSLVLERL